jgi:deoxyribose-phosphate aldolase
MKDRVLKRAEELISLLKLNGNELDRVQENLSAEYVCTDVDLFSAVSVIDHTCLSFDAARKDIINLCQEADKYKLKAVCLNPVWVKKAFEERERLGGDFLIATVIDFPLGASTASARVAETEQALIDGADELDLVISTGLLKSHKLRECYDLIKCVWELGGYLKVILETSALDMDQKIDAALISLFAGARMLKTSTGVNGKATVEDVKLLRTIAGNAMGVKAAGGIRDKKTLISMVEAGADRIGCSSTVSILDDW